MNSKSELIQDNNFIMLKFDCNNLVLLVKNDKVKKYCDILNIDIKNMEVRHQYIRSKKPYHFPDDKEVYRTVELYGELIEVSNYGNVKGYTVYENKKPNKPDKKGYKCIYVNKHNIRINRLVLFAFDDIEKYAHRLFKGFSNDYAIGCEANHIDGDKHNNNINNLEWTTPQENKNHAFLNNLSNYNDDVISWNGWTIYGAKALQYFLLYNKIPLSKPNIFNKIDKNGLINGERVTIIRKG